MQKVVYWLCLFVLCSNVSNAQNIPYFLIKNCKSQFFRHPTTIEVQTYLNQHLHTTFELIYQKQSPAGKHLFYQQKYQGYPIFYATAKVNYTLKNECNSILSTALPYVKPTTYHFLQEEVTTKYNYLFKGKNTYQIEEGFLPSSDSTITPVFKINLRDNGLNESYYIDANTLNILYYQDHRVFFSYSSDSDTTGYVFYPDPLTSSGNTYGSCGIFCTDNNDANNPLLETQRKEVKLKGLTYNTLINTFELKGPYVEIVDLGTPVDTLAQSSTAKFEYTRNQQGFEQTNAYYFIDRMQRYVQCLGFNNIGNRPVRVDAHYGNADNSFYLQPFVSGTAGDIHLGTGGVDDAEDMDVIIHEYGHALSNEASPNSNSGTQRMAVDEAIGDYFASSLSRAMYPYSAWYHVFNWDGHNPFWSGRVTNSTKKYPTHLTGNIYADAPIFSSALMDIWTDLGASKTDKLVLQMLYGLTNNMSMQDAAMLLLQAECSLFGGMYFNTVKMHLVERGLIPDTVSSFSGCSVASSVSCNFDEVTTIEVEDRVYLLNFYPNPAREKLFVELPQKQDKLLLEIKDVFGRSIFSKEVNQDNALIEVDISFLSAGVYILRTIIGGSLWYGRLVKQE